jgi:hypothetical protein
MRELPRFSGLEFTAPRGGKILITGLILKQNGTGKDETTVRNTKRTVPTVQSACVVRR